MLNEAVYAETCHLDAMGSAEAICCYSPKVCKVESMSYGWGFPLLRTRPVATINVESR